MPVTSPVDDLVGSPTRFLFFTGKGGVGKTSLSCATTIALADRGKRVLLASTDPASNLNEVLGVDLASTPRPVPFVPRLDALNIDPQAAAHEYRERLVGPYRGRLPDAAIRSMEEQLSGGCTVEIAAFDEFTNLLGNPAATEAYDHVIFDTAPTGHTLRLLALPGAWTGFLKTNASASCLGPLAGLEKQRCRYEAALQALSDAKQTTVVLVSRPQVSALREAERTQQELAALGVHNQRLIINGVFHAAGNDSIAVALENRGKQALIAMGPFVQGLPTIEVPLRGHNLVGIPALRAIAVGSEAPAVLPADVPSGGNGAVGDTESLRELIDDLASTTRGVIMTMGKGGVGKTTIAAAIATELARRGFGVHLSTTDPAAHVATVAGAFPGLTVSRIDPAAETRAYVEHVMSTAGAGLDAGGRALLEEDLRSPCTEEVAVFRAFARMIAQGGDEFVVLDTAPTGHTLLLLDTAEAYHREVGRRSDDMPAEVRQLLPRLRDPLSTRVLVITVPEPTPIHEAAALQEDLRRADIEPFAWVINQGFAGTATVDPLLRARAANEVACIREVVMSLASRTALVPWVPVEPVGPGALKDLLAARFEGSTDFAQPSARH